MRAAAWARRQLKVSECETRCRGSIQQVYREGVDAAGKGAVEVLQWRLHKSILLRGQQKGDRGWVRHRAR